MSVVPIPEFGAGPVATTIEVRVGFNVLTLLLWYSPRRLRMRWLHATHMIQVGRLGKCQFVEIERKVTTHLEFVTGYQSWKQ